MWKGSTKERNILFVFCWRTAGSGMYCIQAKCFFHVVVWEGRDYFLQKIRHLFTTWGRILNVTELYPSHYTVFRGLNVTDYYDSRKKNSKDTQLSNYVPNFNDLLVQVLVVFFFLEKKKCDSYWGKINLFTYLETRKWVIHKKSEKLLQLHFLLI